MNWGRCDVLRQWHPSSDVQTNGSLSLLHNDTSGYYVPLQKLCSALPRLSCRRPSSRYTRTDRSLHPSWWSDLVAEGCRLLSVGCDSYPETVSCPSIQTWESGCRCRQVAKPPCPHSSYLRTMTDMESGFVYSTISIQLAPPDCRSCLRSYVWSKKMVRVARWESNSDDKVVIWLSVEFIVHAFRTEYGST